MNIIITLIVVGAVLGFLAFGALYLYSRMMSDL